MVSVFFRNSAASGRQAVRISCAKWLSSLAISALLLSPWATATANVITFEDVPGALLGQTLGTIPDGYKGFAWSSFGFMDGAALNPGSGYEFGTVSGSYIAFNEFADVATVNDSLFTFEEVWLTAAWNDGLSITIEGLQLGNTLFSTTVQVDHFFPVLFQFDWIGINELQFTSSGGINAGLGGSGAHFAMDDFTFTPLPEPPAAPLAGVGLLLLAALRRVLAG